MEQLLAHFFHWIGGVKEVYTQDDFYNYIKGLEYMICVGFFFVFVKFYNYINKLPEDRKKEE